MIRAVVAGAFWLSSVITVFAQTADYKSRQNLGMAAAYLSVCPFMQATPRLSEEIAKRKADRSLKNGDAIYESEQRITIASMKENTIDEACVFAEAHFGPEGVTEKGWLSRDLGRLPFPVERLLAFEHDEDPADPVRHKLIVIAGVAFSLQQCTRLEVTDAYAEFLRASGINVGDFTNGILSGPFYGEVLNFIRWQSRDPERKRNACAIALRNYGPGGRVSAGLVRME